MALAFNHGASPLSVCSTQNVVPFCMIHGAARLKLTFSLILASMLLHGPAGPSAEMRSGKVDEDASGCGPGLLSPHFTSSAFFVKAVHPPTETSPLLPEANNWARPLWSGGPYSANPWQRGSASHRRAAAAAEQLRNGEQSNGPHSVELSSWPHRPVPQWPGCLVASLMQLLDAHV